MQAVSYYCEQIDEFTDDMRRNSSYRWDGRTAVKYAVETSWIWAVQKLIESGADLEAPCANPLAANIWAIKGATVLHY